MTGAEPARALEDAHRREWPRVVAATVRVARDLDLAEECVQEAYAEALRRWPLQGVPTEPGAWLTTVARRRAVDAVRRESTLRAKTPLLVEARSTEEPAVDEAAAAEAGVRDDLLRLVLLCCHPALAPDARTALTLRLVCGVPTADVARLFLLPEATVAARITRAKRRIAGSGIPFRLPADELPERMAGVRDVVHLLFTAGHTGPSGDALLRPELLDAALHLARLLHEALPADPETTGLLALLTATDARRGSRVDESGRLVRLADQDRTVWDRAAIRRARELLQEALPRPEAGRYCLQAAIAVLHAEPARAEDTDLPQILGLYDRLLEVWPSPVVRLNRAVVLGQVSGPAAALRELEPLLLDPHLADHHLLHAVLGDVLEQQGRPLDAARHAARAAGLASNAAEAAHLRARRAALAP